MKSITLLCILFLSIDVSALGSIKKIKFIAKEEIPFSAIGKAQSYQGILKFLDSEDLFEYYKLAPSRSLKVSLDYCQAIKAHFFGPSELIKIEFKNGHTGPVCLFESFDANKTQSPAFKLAIVGFINAEPIGLIQSSYQSFSQEKKQEILKLWQTLR